MVLRDDDAPEGSALGKPDMPDEILKIHKEAGKLRRLYAEAKKLTEASPPTPVTTMATIPPPENAGPPQLTFEQIQEMKKAWKANYPGELPTDENTPGPRYWSNTYSMLQSGRSKRYDPWTKITFKLE